MEETTVTSYTAIETDSREIAAKNGEIATEYSENGAKMVALSVSPTKYRGEATRFKPGNPGGPGRPKRETIEARFSRLISDHTTDEEFIAVWDKVKEDAAQGFKAARKDFLAYTLGNPLTRIGAQTDGLASILDMLGPAE